VIYFFRAYINPENYFGVNVLREEMRMSVIAEIIRVEEDGGLSFGNYLAKEKCKISDFEVEGDLYNVKTHNQVTRLEKNNKLLFESVPGAAVHGFTVTKAAARFSLEGYEDTSVTIELLPDSEYKIIIDEMNVGNARSNLSGKINFSVDLRSGIQNVQIDKC